MKILLTVDQLKKILASEPLHLPLIIKMDRVSKKEFKELSAIIKDNKKRLFGG
ncbi:hypothetical protein [Flavobacterium sp.]|uniref:hypothetical protein n=1 Tax=Flavobacterium sp. TaxID=239 RepID=UPI004033E221